MGHLMLSFLVAAVLSGSPATPAPAEVLLELRGIAKPQPHLERYERDRADKERPPGKEMNEKK